ncbi:MAG: hypothetical protein CME15_02085 [Gemmatimonadetes bacterium]|jgi:hypothetical protein|nr:hypothetical protein [Gemmatimonadota bacterium]
MIVRRCAGELIIAFSGDRDSHTCKTANAQLRRGQNLERSGRRPQHALDDRDAGLVETSGGTLITSWFPRWSSGPAYWPRGAGALDGALDAALYGFGVTGEPVRSVGLYPHGPVLDDSRLLYPDSGTFDGTHGRRPEPIVPGQHIWYYPQQETEAGETVCGIIRCPGAVV